MRTLRTLVILLAFVTTCYAADVFPRSIRCPFDGQQAGFTGRTRPAGTGVECQYIHVHFGYDGSIIHEQKHELWAPCQVMNASDSSNTKE